MSVEALLTVVTVVLAVLALIPQERGQDLRIRLGGSALIVGGAAALLVLYWAFMDQIHALPLVRRLPRPVPWLDQWSPASLSLLTMLLATGFAAWRYLRPLPVSRVPQLASTIADALARRRLGECLHLLEVHFTTLRRALHGEYWRAWFRRRWFPTFSEQFIRAQVAASSAIALLEPAQQEFAEPGEDPPGMLVGPNHEILIRLPTQPGRLVRAVTDWAERPREAAEQVVRGMSLAPGLVREIASANPYLALRLLQLESTWVLREFAESFARALLEDPDTVFYRELRRAESVDSNGIVLIEERDQPLLSELCADGALPRGPRLPTSHGIGMPAP